MLWTLPALGAVAQSPGDRMRITVAGHEDLVRGTFTSLSSDELTLLVNANQRSIPLDSIDDAWVFHSIPAWPIVGGFAALGAAGMLIQHENVEQQMPLAVGVLFGAAVGVGFGALLYYVVPVDHGFWKRVELVAPTGSLGFRVRVLPAISPRWRR